MSKIIHAVTDFPEHYYEQEELIEALSKNWAQKHFNLDRLKNFHRNVMVGGRHLALPIERYNDIEGFENSNTAWIEEATKLAQKTVSHLLESSNVEPSQISLITSTTITGIAVPSLEARLINKIDFSANIKRMPLFGLGCLGGAAGLSRVDDYLRAYPDQLAILLSVELCSLTLQQNDLSIANIVSSGLFGDGAAAVLVAGDRHPLAQKNKNRPTIIDNRSIFFPETERIMGWDMVDSGFKIVLDNSVPEFARQNLKPSIADFLEEHKLNIDDIDVWIAHPGGPKVIDGMEDGLGLATGTLDASRQSLRELGNLSSTSVLNILDRTLQGPSPKAGSFGVLLAMGPGFCAEALLLKW